MTQIGLLFVFLKDRRGNDVGISKRTLETLVDLVEIKLSCMEVYDREDSRELANLERCLAELKSVISTTALGDVVALTSQTPARHVRAPRAA